MRWTLTLLGTPSIRDAEGREREVRGHQAWAALTRILLARAAVDRRTLAEELFPATIDPMGSLRWALAALRKAFDDAECLRGDAVEANLPRRVEVDVWRLDDEDFDILQAGRLLQGVEPRSSAEFSTWLLIERQRMAASVDTRLRRDALRALSNGDTERGLALAQRGVMRNGLDEGAHVLLVRSLALAGLHETALEHVEATERLFVEELGERPSAALRSAARRSLASPPGGVSPAVFVNSLIQSGLAALSAGAVDAGVDCLRRAAGEAEKVRDRPLFARALLELGTALVHSVRGYDDEGSILLRQSADAAKSTGEAALASTAFRELGYVEALAGRRPSAAQYLVEAANLAESRDALAGVRAVEGFNLVDWGRVEEGLEAYRAAIEAARGAGNRRWEIWSLGIGARGLIAADRLAEADVWLRRCLELVEEQRWTAFRPWPVALLGECELRQRRDLVRIRPELEASFAMSCQLGDPCWEGAVARTLALTYGAEGDLAAAASWLGEASRRSQRETDGYVGLQVDIFADQAELSRRLGRPDEARAHANAWITLAARTDMDRHIERAAAFITRTNLERAGRQA